MFSKQFVADKAHMTPDRHIEPSNLTVRQSRHIIDIYQYLNKSKILVLCSFHRGKR